MNEETKDIQKNEGRPAEKGTKYTPRQIGLRILATLFFGIVVWAILETIICLIVIFQIVYTLITESPNTTLISFSNRVVSYVYKVFRYLTFNEDRMPFPFSRFPDEMEEPEVK